MGSPNKGLWKTVRMLVVNSPRAQGSTSTLPRMNISYFRHTRLSFSYTNVKFAKTKTCIFPWATHASTKYLSLNYSLCERIYLDSSYFTLTWNTNFCCLFISNVSLLFPKGFHGLHKYYLALLKHLDTFVCKSHTQDFSEGKVIAKHNKGCCLWKLLHIGTLSFRHSCIDWTRSL